MRVKTNQPTKMELIRAYLKKFHADDDEWSTNEVIEQIYTENLERSNLQASLFSTRSLLRKDQYSELKDDIN